MQKIKIIFITDQDKTLLKLPLLQLNGNVIERENSLKFLDDHLN